MVEEAGEEGEPDHLELKEEAGEEVEPDNWQLEEAAGEEQEPFEADVTFVQTPVCHFAPPPVACWP